MIKALAKLGWTQDFLYKPSSVGDEIQITMSHPSFPSCDLSLIIELCDPVENEERSPASISLQLRSIDLDGEWWSYKWMDQDIDLSILNDRASRMQDYIDQKGIEE
jgi:hypothetical protein